MKWLDNGTIYDTAVFDDTVVIAFIAIDDPRVILRKNIADAYIKLLEANAIASKRIANMFSFITDDKVDKDAKYKWDICGDANVSCKIEIIDYGKTRK